MTKSYPIWNQLTFQLLYVPDYIEIIKHKKVFCHSYLHINLVKFIFHFSNIFNSINELNSLEPALHEYPTPAITVVPIPADRLRLDMML